MKLAFSTLGCPAWTLAQVIEAAQRDGYDGVEFRGLRETIELTEAPDFSPAHIADTRARLADAGVAVACVSTGLRVVSATTTRIDRHTLVEHARRYVDLAKEVNAPYIRLFCGEVPEHHPRAIALEQAVDALQQIGDFAQGREVIALLETHDAFVSSGELMDLLRLTHHPAVQVLWDIHHPYRLAGETIAQTMRNLHGHIRSTHVKDSVLHEDGEQYTFVPVGQGDVPIPAALRVLHDTGYDGYLTFEWEQRWHPHLAAPEIVFPQYVRQMRAWLAELQ
jgi:sugar phosphate isomerase/epimerase